MIIKENKNHLRCTMQALGKEGECRQDKLSETWMKNQEMKST